MKRVLRLMLWLLAVVIVVALDFAVFAVKEANESAKRSTAFAAEQREATRELQQESVGVRSAADKARVNARALMEIVDLNEQIRQKEAELAAKQAEWGGLSNWQRLQKHLGRYRKARLGW